jgi:TP901-1 family phage major tail protein
MSTQNGRDMLVKVKQNDGSYRTLAGLRSKALRLNAKPIDVTNTDSADGWKELLPHAGIKSADISGTGVFKNDESAGEAREAFFSQSHLSLRFILPGFGQIDGPFMITSLNYTGSYQGEAGFEVNFVSAGLPVFTAVI